MPVSGKQRHSPTALFRRYKQGQVNRTALLQLILSCLRITTDVLRDTVFTEKNCIMSSKSVLSNLGQGVELGLCSKASSRKKRKGEKSLTQVFQAK